LASLQAITGVYEHITNQSSSPAVIVLMKKHFPECNREPDILIPREITQFFVVLDGFSSSIVPLDTNNCPWHHFRQ
jgi:hypothetical protein